MVILSQEQIQAALKKVHQGNDPKVSRKKDDWILEPLVPHKAIVVLDGLGGAGKSWFAIDLAFAISHGVDFLGRYPVRKPGVVFYLTAEETPERFVDRLDQLTQSYGTNDNFYWVSTLEEGFPFGSSIFQKDGWRISKTEMASAIELYIEEYNPTLIVIDSLINFYGLNENNSDEAKRFYDLLTNWIKTYQCSFLLLHHQTKDSLRLQDYDGVFRGSIVFREQARQRMTYRSIKFEHNGKTVTARKVSIEKANYYSPLLEEFPIYLRWSDGIHIYDEQFEKKAKEQEEARKRFQPKKIQGNNKEKNNDSTSLTGKNF
jgi:RecA-family ATPase